MWIRPHMSAAHSYVRDPLPSTRLCADFILLIFFIYSGSQCWSSPRFNFCVLAALIGLRLTILFCRSPVRSARTIPTALPLVFFCSPSCFLRPPFCLVPHRFATVGTSGLRCYGRSWVLISSSVARGLVWFSRYLVHCCHR
jgi:hypothetical protein